LRAGRVDHFLERAHRIREPIVALASEVIDRACQRSESISRYGQCGKTHRPLLPFFAIGGHTERANSVRECARDSGAAHA
jgi:hypothetical protein